MTSNLPISRYMVYFLFFTTVEHLTPCVLDFRQKYYHRQPVSSRAHSILLRLKGPELICKWGGSIFQIYKQNKNCHFRGQWHQITPQNNHEALKHMILQSYTSKTRSPNIDAFMSLLRDAHLFSNILRILEQMHRMLKEFTELQEWDNQNTRLLHF